MNKFFESISRFNKLVESDEAIRRLEREYRADKGDKLKLARLVDAKKRAGIYSSESPMKTARKRLAKVKIQYRKGTAQSRRPQAPERPEQTQLRRRLTLNKHRAAARLGIQRAKEGLEQKGLADHQKQKFHNAIALYREGLALAKEAHKVNKPKVQDMFTQRQVVSRLGASAARLADAHQALGIREKKIRNYPPGAELP